ncbi:MAG: hypothetical protein J7L91_04590 [Candidatus Korarchaeota archaeon]|nr:hypothetical protein [Candidatus Korarchaeota archaeon]
MVLTGFYFNFINRAGADFSLEDILMGIRRGDEEVLEALSELANSLGAEILEYHLSARWV